MFSVLINLLDDSLPKMMLNRVGKSQIFVSNVSSSWATQNLQVLDFLNSRFMKIKSANHVHHENTPVQPSTSYKEKIHSSGSIIKETLM